MASQTSEVQRLKELGNIEFKNNRNRQAIKLYTNALECVHSTTPIELQRTILANRAQAYISYGIIHDALQDLNCALSPQYTTRDSPKALTVECHYRRAKLLFTMAKYDEANLDYAELVNIRGEQGMEMSREEVQLKEDIDRRAQASEDSERRRKDELMRAIDARGFILRQPYRESFPLPPPDVLEALGPDFDPEEMTLHFDTSDGRPNRRLPDPNLTPISLPMYIRAPYFKSISTSKPPFSARVEITVSEYDTVESFIEGVFISVATSRGGGDQEDVHSAIKHDRGSPVIVITSNGRFLVIPRKTRVRDIVAGAQWPRPQGATEIPLFEDLRKGQIARREAIDGIELGMGWMMEVYVVPKENIMEFINRLETGFKELGV